MVGEREEREKGWLIIQESSCVGRISSNIP
jgi:hypothetical protein